MSERVTIASSHDRGAGGRRPLAFYTAIVLLWAIYVALLAVTPNDTDVVFHLGLTLANFIRITFAVPLLLIWLISARTVIYFISYAKILDGTAEGKGFRDIARGLAWLLACIIAIILLGRMASVAVHTTYAPLLVFLKSHLPFYILLVSFAQLYLGSTYFVNHPASRVPKGRSLMVWILYFIFSAIYAVIFFNRPDTPANSINKLLPAFAVSHDTLLFTLILPSLIAWILGIIASINISAYAYYVRGVIYKRALRSLTQGIIAVTILTILLEVFLLNVNFIARLGLVVELGIIYTLLVAYALASLWIYRGARRLAQIEEAI